MEESQGQRRGGIPKRLLVGIMMFMHCFINYTMRVNFSLNIIAMVEPIAHGNATVAPVKDLGPRYPWSQRQQGLLLGAYFYGYMISSLPAGTLSEMFGGRNVGGWSCAAAAVLTILTPITAAIHMWAVFISRFLIGFLSGVGYPVIQNLISRWAPPAEKGKFVSTLMGGTFGTVITWPVCGLIIENLGWPWANYLVGLFVLFVLIFWFCLVADSPADHSTITEEEREFIENSLGGAVGSKKKRVPPYKSFVTSVPFWALLFLHYGNTWGLYFLITATPKFLSEVLGFKLGKTGFLASLPHFARIFFAFGFGSVADYIRKNDVLSVTMIRKTFCIPSHIIPGAFLILIAMIGRDAYVCVAIITISLAFNGAATASNLQNPQDLAPNFAGTIFGIINCVGTTPGFFSPLMVGEITKEANTMKEWSLIFIIGGCVYIFPAVLFMFFGTGQRQSWNEIPEEE